MITASDITAHKSGTGGFHVVVSGPVSFDLLEIGGIEKILGEADLETGKYTQMRLIIVSVVVTIDGKDVLATVPSGVVKLVGLNLQVDAEETTIVTLDFDADKQLTVQPDGEIKFRPTIKVLSRKGGSGQAQSRVSGVVNAKPSTPSEDGTMQIAVTDSSVPAEATPTPAEIPSACLWSLIVLAILLAGLLAVRSGRRGKRSLPHQMA